MRLASPLRVGWSFALGAALALAGCVDAAREPQIPSAVLLTAGAPPVDARALVTQSPFTVFVFFSRGCHCFEQHEARLRDLYAAYHPRGVGFVVVDSEVRVTPESDAAEASRRGYPFPIFVDPGARVADALGARYATYSVVVNAEGRVLYRGGIDADTTHLRPESTPYLRDALDDVLAGRPLRRAVAKTLGCSLETW